MASDPAFRDEVTARLIPMGPVEGKRMFGGFGIFLDGRMFGLIARDELYFKVDDANRPAYEAAGSGPFTYERKGKPASLNYWRVPDVVYEDPSSLISWAGDAHAVAMRSAAKKPKKPKRK